MIFSPFTPLKAFSIPPSGTTEGTTSVTRAPAAAHAFAARIITASAPWIPRA
jgi:hypothetical protein